MRNMALSLQSIPIGPEPNDPVPVPDPRPRRTRFPTRRRTMTRLNCRIKSGDLRGYAPADCPPFNARKHCDRFFNTEPFARSSTEQP